LTLDVEVGTQFDPSLRDPRMEPGEKFLQRLLKFALMILAFIIAIVFGEYYRGLGWL